jgi:hypothetical protein
MTSPSGVVIEEPSDADATAWAPAVMATADRGRVRT